MRKEFRAGAVGAMMDEYERAANEFLDLVMQLDVGAFEKVRDTKTTDDECRSIQTVAAHVIGSGHAYADYFRDQWGMPKSSPERLVYTLPEVPVRLHAMLAYTVETLEGRWQMTDEEIMAVRIRTRWGGLYDVEQLLEHAIVHVLRHRRQVEKFLAR